MPVHIATRLSNVKFMAYIEMGLLGKQSFAGWNNKFLNKKTNVKLSNRVKMKNIYQFHIE